MVVTATIKLQINVCSEVPCPASVGYLSLPHSPGSFLTDQVNIMAKKMFVGNLSFQTTESDVRAAFEQYGAVESVAIITDRDTGRSKGFGFVEMSEDDANKAIAGLSGSELDGRALTVNEAKPMVKRDFGGGGDRGGRGGGGGGRGGGRY